MLKQLAPLAKRIEFNDANTATLVVFMPNYLKMIQVFNDNNIDYADEKRGNYYHIDVEIEDIA